ncbi:DUF3048 domain-containing protein [Nocardioides massiliensis]|uniref:DUF3048 domain-containing protein n=1 Tax=Nocardioides massiliensis TaxID=1325935 RepID=A0ABT9NIT8_9ACTN|nr:DUF3048 domain-containing protein [Nocardioides massiliensis]MDP9820317.1 hypothetical protein [Nocardioides massiliensis]
MRFRSPRAARALALTAGSLAIALTLAACGSNEEPDDAPEAQETVDGSALEARSPLTGELVEGSAPTNPVFVVKIDNTASAAPQLGLSAADLVAEQLVEGGDSRLAAFFYSELPERVGPVRSSRTTDIGIVKPLDGVLVASGGAPATVNRLRSEQVTTVVEGAPGFSRDSGRRAPYNLMMDLTALAKETGAGSTPAAYLPWGTDEEFPGARPATTVEAQFSGRRTTTWSFAKGGYTPTNGHAADGDVFRPDTLVVLRVPVGDAGYTDPAGNPVPESRFVGKGEAFVFHGGEVVRGRWTKKGFAGSVQLRTQGGELTLPPGKVWLGLVPADGGDVRFTG